MLIDIRPKSYRPTKALTRFERIRRLLLANARRYRQALERGDYDGIMQAQGFQRGAALVLEIVEDIQAPEFETLARDIARIESGLIVEDDRPPALERG